jgi:hypothetical protein
VAKLEKSKSVGSGAGLWFSTKPLLALDFEFEMPFFLYINALLFHFQNFF